VRTTDEACPFCGAEAPLPERRVEVGLSRAAIMLMSGVALTSVGTAACGKTTEQNNPPPPTPTNQVAPAYGPAPVFVDTDAAAKPIPSNQPSPPVPAYGAPPPATSPRDAGASKK